MQLSHLFSLQWVETAGLGRLDFGCAPIAPADFEEHGTTLFGLVAGVGEPSAPREAHVGDLEHMQILCCLTVRKLKRPNEEPVDFALCLARSDEDESRNLLWVGRIPVDDIVHIAGAGMRQYIEAATRAARFRQRTATPADAGRDSEEVRTDSGPLAAEASR